MFYIQWVEDNLWVWGRIESVMTILDFHDLKITDIPLKSLASIAYPILRMMMGYGMYAQMINASWIMNKVFSIARSMFDDVSNEAIFMCTKEDTYQSLLGYLRPDEIQQRHGGTMPNIKQSFPPVY